MQPVPELRADVDVQSIPEPTGDVELACQSEDLQPIQDLQTIQEPTADESEDVQPDFRPIALSAFYSRKHVEGNKESLKKG